MNCGEIMEMEIANSSVEEQLLRFYASFIGSDGCTWHEDYPNLEIIREDLKNQRTFMLQDEKGIVATISIDDDQMIEELEIWEIPNAVEVARIAVREDCQNQGIGVKVLRFMMDLLKKRGYEGMHFLVSQTNDKALACYEKIGFVNRGPLFLYNVNWYCYEIKL